MGRNVIAAYMAAPTRSPITAERAIVRRRTRCSGTTGSRARCSTRMNAPRPSTAPQPNPTNERGAPVLLASAPRDDEDQRDERRGQERTTAQVQLSALATARGPCRSAHG